MENKFMRVEEVAEVLEVSTSFAYKVIRQLNDELKAKGFITIAGRINREYFYERLYHTHYLPLQDAVDYPTEQFELMRSASLTVDRDMTVCQCEYRKEGEQE